jgi:hypothetical protein
MHFSPGHTPGLCAMQVNLERDGTFIWTTDQFHVKENFEMRHPHGWLARDLNAWIKSTKMLAKLKEQFGAKMIYGHDLVSVARSISLAPAVAWFGLLTRRVLCTRIR